MRPDHRHHRSAHRPDHRRPGNRIGSRVFGFLFFLLVVSAIVGGLISWATTSGRGWFLLIGLAVVIGIGVMMMRAFSRTWAPVSDLIDATTQLGEGDSEVRMRSRGGGPWGAVASSFNRMAERLGDEDERRRRLLADLGHEMRTPLTVIRGEIEAVIDGVHTPESLSNVVAEVELMDRLLEDLRTLALAEAGTLELVIEPTDLGDLVADVVASYRSVTQDQDVSVRLDNNATNSIEVDPHRIHQVVSNLVSNALRVMPEGGTLEVTVDDESITVADTGPGIPEDQLTAVFDRFVKAADSTGSGLGLSIARDLVEAHGGTITVQNRAEGGALFTVTLA
ncbi:MAG: HAMP domain-containing sensor histidine kinase [Actinomycetota bacterium]|nr:HAMP domain-containing sensor histidine kinase [Actinomycetota bacterium]